jgi:hypothetical protein
MKFFTLAVALLGFTAVQANNGPGGPGTGKKDEVNGIVVNSENRKPLKDVSITAVISSKKEKIALTDDAGNYYFDELKPGTYKFIFEKAGFKRITKEKVVVKTDEAFQLNIEMIEEKEVDIMPTPFHFSEF